MMMLFGVACLLPWNAVLTTFAFYTEHVSHQVPYNFIDDRIQSTRNFPFCSQSSLNFLIYPHNRLWLPFYVKVPHQFLHVYDNLHINGTTYTHYIACPNGCVLECYLLAWSFWILHWRRLSIDLFDRWGHALEVPQRNYSWQQLLCNIHQHNSRYFSADNN